jgi:type IV secretion system protein VirB10
MPNENAKPEKPEVKNDPLSPSVSPTIAGGKKKRARRINNWPLFIVFIAVGIILLALGMVALRRTNAAKAEVARQGGKAATVFARDIINASGQAGVVQPPSPPPAPPPPKPEEKPPAPIPPDRPKEEEKPEPAGLKRPETAKLNEDARKTRERRMRQFEAALDSPIKAQIEEVKTQPRSLDAEIAEVERQIAALGGQAGNAYVDRLAAIKAATEGGTGETDYSKRGDLSRMNQFDAVSGNWRNAGEVEAPPANLCVVRTGSVIPATLVGGINSDLPGQIVGQVAQDVYDTPTGKYLLIPQGSRLVGEYSSHVQYGQSRVFAVWQRIIFPDGKALDLGAMPGSSGAGYAGFRDRVNNHYVRIFGSAIMMSAILAGVEMTQNNQGYTDGSNQQRMADALSEALGNQLGGVMAEMLSKNMSIAPTIEIRPGYRLNVMLVKDLEFRRPYRAFD